MRITIGWLQEPRFLPFTMLLTVKCNDRIIDLGVHMKLFQTFLASKFCTWFVVLWVVFSSFYIAFSNLYGGAL